MFVPVRLFVPVRWLSSVRGPRVHRWWIMSLAMAVTGPSQRFESPRRCRGNHPDRYPERAAIRYPDWPLPSRAELPRSGERERRPAKRRR